MVSTRHSIPSAAAAPPTSTSTDAQDVPDKPEPQLSEKAKRILAKLQIDANEAILTGEAPAKQPVDETKIYHYRGAVYERKGDEPEEWLTEEPMRHKKRKSTAVSVTVDDDGEPAQKKRKESVDVRRLSKVENSQTSRKRANEDGVEDEQPVKKKRKDSVGEQPPLQSTSARKSATATPNRRTNSVAEQPRSTSRSLTNIEKYNLSKKRKLGTPISNNPEPKKRKRSTPIVNDEAAIMADSSASPPPASQRRAAPPAARRQRATNGIRAPEDMRRSVSLNAPTSNISPYDFTTNGGHEPRTCAEYAAAKRQRDARDGLQPRPLLSQALSAEEVRRDRSYSTARLVQQLAKVNGQIAESERVLAEVRQQRKVSPKKLQEVVDKGASRGPTLDTHDSAVEVSSPLTKATKSPESVTEGRAEQYIFGGRFKGESWKQLEERQAYEEDFVNRMFAPIGAGTDE